MTADSFIGFAARSSLVSFDSGTRVAWIETVRGVSNVWAAAASDGTPQRWTNFSAEAMELRGLRPMAGSGLVFNCAPLASTNPLHHTRAPGSSTWYVSAHSPPLLVSQNESLISTNEDGTAVLLVRPSGTGESLWELQPPTQTRLHPEATLLFEVKQGSLGGFAWRPGSSVLAFANNRGSHGFVGLYARNGSSIKWVAPSADTDAAPAWSTDGDRLAWYRLMTPVGDAGYSPTDGDQGNRGPDYAVLVADVAWGGGGALSVGRAKVVYQESTYGLASFGYGQRPLAWTPDGALLLGTERPAGWLHLARLDPSKPGSGAQVIRAGACEDRAWLVGAAGSPYAGWAFVSHNCDDIDSRGLEALGVSATTLGQRHTLVRGDPFIVAGESGTTGEPGGGVALAGGDVYWLQAGWESPAAVWRQTFATVGSGGVEAQPSRQDPRPSTSASKLTSDAISSPGWSPRLVRPTPVTFPSPDGAFTLHAQLFTPHAPTGQGVVYTHGGSERQVRGMCGAGEWGV